MVSRTRGQREGRRPKERRTGTAVHQTYDALVGASGVSVRTLNEEGEWLAVCRDFNGDTAIASHSSQKGGDGSRYNENVVGSDRAAWKVADTCSAGHIPG